MAEYLVTTRRATPLGIGGSDTVRIAQSGSIEVSGTCISSTGSGNFIYVDGSVRNVSATGAAIDLVSGNNLYIRESGLVSGKDRAVHMDGVLENKGRIEGGSSGVEIHERVDARSFLNNSGSIIGGTYGVNCTSVAANSTMWLENDGTITGGAVAVRGSDVAGDVIINAGHLSGRYALSLGGGDDAYSSLGERGTVSGIIDMGDGRDSAFGGVSNETMYGGSGEDELSGYRGNDVLHGGAQNDTLDGGAGNDIISGGQGNDLIDGGTGLDLVSYAHLTAGLVFSLREGMISGGEADGVDLISGIEGVIGSQADDRLIGDEAQNYLRGNLGSDKLYGGSGHDSLDGGGGADTLDGGPGNDTYYVNTAGDRVVERSSGGTADRVFTTASHTLAAYVERLYATGSASITLKGNSLANTISGNAGRNKLYGLSGQDRLSGDSGNDLLDGGTSNDSLYGGTGNDKLDGGTGRDVLSGGAGRDIFVFKDHRPGSAYYDKIIDYNRSYDTIQLDNKYMGKLGPAGRLGSAKFVLGTKAKDSNDHLIYDKAKGYLYYDADGSGSAVKPVLIAQFTNKAALTAGEFIII